MFAFWVAIVPKPKLVLAVDAEETSDRFEDAVNLESIWVCIADVTPSKYPNSVFEIVPSCILVASIAALELISAFTIESFTILDEFTESAASFAKVTFASVILAVVTALDASLASVICESAMWTVSIEPSTRCSESILSSAIFDPLHFSLLILD